MLEFKWNCYLGKSCFKLDSLKRIMAFCRLFLANWCFLTICILSVIIWKCPLSMWDLCVGIKLINSNKFIKPYIQDCSYEAIMSLEAL